MDHLNSPVGSPASSSYNTPLAANKPQRPRLLNDDSEPEPAALPTEDVDIPGKLISSNLLLSGGYNNGRLQLPCSDNASRQAPQQPPPPQYLLNPQSNKPPSVFRQVADNNLKSFMPPSNPLSSDHSNQQQQLLSNSDHRMSREKQKFFRSSAFNSGHIKSPPKAGTTPNAAWSVTLASSRQPIPNHQVHTYNDERDRNYKRVRNKSGAGRKKKNKPKPLVANSSSSESSGSSDADSSSSQSSSDSASESSDDDESYSSSADSEAANDENALGLLARAEQMPTWTSLNGDNRSNSQQTFSSALNGFQQLANTDGAGEWGFAAEAKKHADAFAVPTKSPVKVFGSEASVNDVQLSDDKPASHHHRKSSSNKKKDSPRKQRERPKNNQLENLFDGLSQFFQTTDINRQKLKQKKKNKLETTPERIASPPSKAVLKETRRTFRDYENSMRRKSSSGDGQDFPNQYSSNLVKTAASSGDLRKRHSSHKLPNFAIMSSDDDFSQLSPSKLVKRAISFKKYETGNNRIFVPPSASPAAHQSNSNSSLLKSTFAAANTTGLGGGFANADGMLDFASLATSTSTSVIPSSFNASMSLSSGGNSSCSNFSRAGRTGPVTTSDSVPPYSNPNSKIGKSPRYTGMAEVFQ